MTEPVATLSACLCGLDTNPVASPRMDIHCPKHDAPEAVGEPSDEEFNPWYENHEKALVAEVSSPTPADEEVAREIEQLLNRVGHTCRCTSCQQRITEAATRITTALAEARRSGTPTTDARAGAWSKEFPSTNGWYWLRGFRQYRDLPCWVEDGRVYMMFSTHMFNRADFIEDGGEWRRMVKPDAPALSSTPSDAIIAELKRVEPGAANYDAVPLEERVRRVVNRLINASTPGDKVAQRARAAAEEIERVYDRDTTEIEEVEEIINKHCFTVTDVEQGTCTEHEK